MNYLEVKKKYRTCKFLNIYSNYIKPLKFELHICFLFLIIFTVTNLSYPYFLKLIIDDAMFNKSLEKLFMYTFIIVITVIIMLVSKYFVANKSLSLCQQITLKLRQNITNQLLRYSQSFFIEYENSQIISIIENDLQYIQSLSIYIITEFLVAAITIIGLLFIIFSIDYKIAISCIILLIIYTYLQNINGKKVKANSLELSKRKGELYSYTQKFIYNILDIKMLNYQKTYQKKYGINCKKYFELESRVVKSGIFSSILGIIFKNLGLVLVLCLGGYKVLVKEMSTGVLFSLTIYVQQLFSPIITLTNLYIEFKKAQASFQRISKLLNSDKYIIRDGDVCLSKPLSGKFILKDISFKYNNDFIFNKANIEINNGEKVALLGSNGSGKTTLIRLLMRLQENYNGKIFLGGHNIEDYKLDYLRENILCISQSPFIFNGTILENISLYNKKIPIQIINKVVKMVCLEEDIKNMEKGIHTIIGEKGISLSGGQAQKIALARVFVSNHPIIILDEPTSALDVKSEKIICKNLYKNLNKKTIIVITHRKEILEYCSKIYEIKNNDIIENKKYKL